MSSSGSLIKDASFDSRLESVSSQDTDCDSDESWESVDGLPQNAEKPDTEADEQSRDTRVFYVRQRHECFFCSVKLWCAQLLDELCRKPAFIKSDIIWRLWLNWANYVYLFVAHMFVVLVASLPHNQILPLSIASVAFVFYAPLFTLLTRVRLYGLLRSISYLNFEIFAAIFGIQIILSIVLTVSIVSELIQTIYDPEFRSEAYAYYSLAFKVPATIMYLCLHAWNAARHFDNLRQLHSRVSRKRGSHLCLKDSLEIICSVSRDYLRCVWEETVAYVKRDRSGVRPRIIYIIDIKR